MSLVRPVIMQYPSSSSNPSSPECIHKTPNSSRFIALAVCSLSFQYPFWSKYPAKQTSPRWPMGTIFPSASTILADVCGSTWPTVVSCFSIESDRLVMNATGDVSVIPSRC
ncbi:hypothetical protein RRF57_011121 [Xylaria bambusicola]|uniref:Uncharacterized protein n=1 Tax=Xylaria bambusicola TaxID=326684 RepID=A0AAN7UW38_9PEZI